MRGSRSRAGLTGVCAHLSCEVAKFFDGRSPLPLNGRRAAASGRRRALQIEALEVRHLMDAAGLAALVTPSWFQTVADVVGPQHAGAADWTAEAISASGQTSDASAAQSDLYDWIVQFNTAGMSQISSVAETTSLLVGGGIEFQAISGLGLAGQVLVRSYGASLTEVEDWLTRDIYISSFEQDALRQIETTPNDPQMGSLWGMTAIDAQDAWRLATGSQSVVVAVIDTGVDYNHPDLAANIWTNPGEIAGNGIDDDHNGFIDDVHGYDFVNNDGSPLDDNSHGTHVAGTIAAVGNNAIGVSGVNWSTSVMALKFMDSTGSGYLSDAIRAINYATMMRTQYHVNIRVENNSWGGGPYSSAMQSAIQANNDAGILFVAAAGNDGTNNDTSPQYPANYTPANVISVAATDQNDRLASFSCYGATTVDIAAPGVSIYSTIPNNRYATYSGTSMATPFVAGVAALAWSIDPDASVATIRSAILNGADSIASLGGKVATGGRLNAYNTLRLLGVEPTQGPVVAALTITPNPVLQGSTITLAAAGIADATSAVTALKFYRDTNNNGQYDIGDMLVGSTTTIVGGSASVQISTAGMAAGTYRYFARAVDANASWSSAATTLMTILPPDDFGNNAGTASAIGVPSTTQGVLGVAGDVDWFSFQAVAGQSYTIATQLGTLRDSVLYLYDRNGTTLVAQDDDGGGNLASQLRWQATSTGTYYVAVASYGNAYVGTYALSVQSQNATRAAAAVGVYNPVNATIYLRTAQGSGAADAAFTCGAANSGWTTLTGDWDGDGVDTIGMYDPVASVFHLQNSNESGNATIDFAYGPARGGWKPVVGDWDGDGRDTVGLYNPTTSVFYLSNRNVAGYADLTFAYGPANGGWQPLAGDWNGDGKDTIGLYNPVASVVYLRNTNNGGYANVSFAYGPANGGWKPLAGDWNGDGTDTIGLYNATAATFYLRNSNDAGYANTCFAFGPANRACVPLVGNWTVAQGLTVHSQAATSATTAALTPAGLRPMVAGALACATTTGLDFAALDELTRVDAVASNLTIAQRGQVQADRGPVESDAIDAELWRCDGTWHRSTNWESSEQTSAAYDEPSPEDLLVFDPVEQRALDEVFASLSDL